MTPDEQEALSRRFGDDIIILLPLKRGRIAVFNAARILCGIANGPGWFSVPDDFWDNIVEVTWHPPSKPPKGADFTLEDLGL